MLLLFVQQNFIINHAKEHFIKKAWMTKAAKQLRDMYYDIH